MVHLEKTTPKCKTSPNCDSTLTKQLTQTSKLNNIIDSITFHNPNDSNNLDQENRAPSEMSTCDSEELLSREMVETQESDDSASDAGATVGNYWAKNNKQMFCQKNNRRKQSRPQRCSNYLRDRNNSLDSAIDLGDQKDSEEDEDFPSQNGSHDRDTPMANGDEPEENGNDCKYMVTSQMGLPCVFQNSDHENPSTDSPCNSDIDSYVLTENYMMDRENGTPSGESEAEAMNDEPNMDNVIRIEPLDPDSAASEQAAQVRT